MAAYLNRDGYDFLLGERPGQKKAVERVEDLFRRNPESQMALLFWVLLHAEHPDGIKFLRGTVLPRARNLVQQAPDFPPYRHLLGHFEWRSGNLLLAEKEFARAAELFESYMQTQKMSYYDCPNWLQSKLYLATTYKSLDEFEKALAIASELNALQIDDERLESPGAALLLWEGKTLSSRLHLAEAKDGSYKLGLDTLPEKEIGKYYAGKSPAVLAWEGWRNTLAARNAIQSSVFDRARVYLEGVAVADELLVAAQDGIVGRSCRAEWLRARRAFSIQAANGQALLTLAQDAAALGKAEFWMQSAIDRQAPAAGLTPPILLTPIELRLALVQAAAGKHEQAAASFEKAMARFPNDIAVLKAVAAWSESKGDVDQAKEYREHILVVKGK